MSIKMLALDLDGTTLNSQGILTNRTSLALEKAAEKKVNVVVSTGRVFSALPDAVLDFPIIRYAITSNGAHIIDLRKKEVIYNDYIAKDALDKAIEICKEYSINIEVFINNRAYIDQSFFDYIKENGCAYRNVEYVLRTRQPVKNIIQLLEENSSEVENINFFFKDVAELEAHRTIIESIPNGMITSSFKHNLELGGPGTCKKKALLVLMEMLNVKREELMCCGDAPNDIEMIKYAGIGVAMGNAWGSTKEYADYVTASNDEDGVAQAVERFVL